MNEQEPSQDFDSQAYERPNQKWICGKAAEGHACRLGPDSKGRCHVTYECQPGLKVDKGETKGRYVCTRPSMAGGSCPNGPLPDGTCCRPLTRCVPVRSLRSKRKLLTFFTAAVTVGILLMALCGPFSPAIISPGSLSEAHASADFKNMTVKKGNCAACHEASRGGLSDWVRDGMRGDPGIFKIKALMAKKDFNMTGIDEHCLTCHTGHSFHQPNVVGERSCSGCHIEHHGPGPMRAPTDANCVACHGNAEMMQASAQMGRNLPPSAFDYSPDLGRVVFHTARPEQGYTQVLHSFATDHPEFQIIREKLRDPDTLQFNHELHLTQAKVSLNGRALNCDDCHKLDSSGIFHLKVTYDANCKMCHPIQFDPNTPALLVPHGNIEHVRSFLRSLPQHYADYDAATNGPGDIKRNQEFALQRIKMLRKLYVSGEVMERAVFLNDKGRGVFPGCAYCHDVQFPPNGDPQITHPVMPERWMTHSLFDHSKHMQNLPGLPKESCALCHDAAHSRLASDVILPSKQVCVQCHSPAGGVADSCSTCHIYHSPRKNALTAGIGEFKETDPAETSRKAVASRDR